MKKRTMLSNKKKCELLFVTIGKKICQKRGILKGIGTQKTRKLGRNQSRTAGFAECQTKFWGISRKCNPGTIYKQERNIFNTESYED